MRLTKFLGIVLTFLLLLGPSASSVVEAATTLLVNTESFQTIDDGDGTTNIEMRFGTTLNEKIYYDKTNSRFQFTRGIFVGGGITATGSLSVKRNISGATLRVDGAADVWGSLSASGSLKTKSGAVINADGDTNDAPLVFGNASGPQSLKFVNGLQRFELSKPLWVNGDLSASGTLSVQNNINTRGDLTINADRGAADATLTFGNATANKAITFSNSNQRFEFNANVKTTGNLSGSTLNVDGATMFRGTSYQWPTAQGSANTFLKNDGAGNLSWGTTSVGNGSGNLLSLHPEYPNTVYTQSGATAVGQLSMSGALGSDNLYRWSTTKGTLQDYWTAVRVQVPKNFANFTSSGGITLRLRTATTNSANNYVTVRLNDTNNNPVAISNNALLVSSTANAWRTVNLGSVTTGTYTPLGYIKVLIKMAATSAGNTDISNLDFRWSTTTP
jgi:hypothetical protein